MSTPTDTMKIMKSNPLFSMLPEEGLLQMVEQSILKSFVADEKLIEENGDNKHLFLLLSGHIRVVSNGTEVDRQQAGDTAGEVSMSRISPPVADVIADGDVEAALFPATVIEQISASYPAFAKTLRETAMKKVYDR